MFSKIRKHLNIMCLLLILLIAILGIVLMGVYSIDDYCQEYIISKIEAEDKVVDNDISYIISNAENMLSILEMSYASNSDVLRILNNIKSTEFIKKADSMVSDVYVIDNNLLYSMKENKNINANDAKESEWYKTVVDKKNIYISNCFDDFNSGEKCIAICKKINSNNAVAAVCIKISNLINKLKHEEIEEAYIINQNNVIVASTSNSYTNVNVIDDHKQLPKGHADIFKNLNIIDGTEEINTLGGRLLVTCTKSNDNIKCIVIRDKTVLIQKINNKYLEILAMFVAAFLLIVGMCVVSVTYTRKVKKVNYSKCEFIESMAAEIKIPLDSINFYGRMMNNDIEDENIAQCVNSIMENAQSIAFVLNSAYDYSKISINDLKIVNNKYSIDSVICNVEKVVRCDVQKNNVYFDSYMEGNKELILYGDQRKIEEIIINLVKIAAHHTIQGGIELKVMYADLTVDRVNVMLIVQDSGVGMTDNELSDYAEELNNVPLSLKVSDTGLGIDIVKQLVKILNGKIAVDSTKNVGTIYTVMIPQKIITTDDNKWENEKVKSSVELMNEFSYIKDTDKIAQYTTQIERKQTTGVERREIKKNEVNEASYVRQQSQDSTENFEENNNDIMNDIYNDSTEQLGIISNEMEYKHNNVEYIPEPVSEVQEQFAKEVMLEDQNKSDNKFMMEKQEEQEEQVNEPIEKPEKNEEQENSSDREDEDGEIYDIPMPANQEQFLMRQNIQQEEFETESEKNDNQEEFEIDAEEDEEQVQNLELKKNIDCINNFFEKYGVDAVQILGEYNNDIDSYKKSLISFYNYSKDAANRIISLWNNKKIKEYFSALDVVKEGALGIGASKLANMIQEQLVKGEQGDLKYVAETIKEVFTEWKMLLGVIVQYLKNCQ